MGDTLGKVISAIIAIFVLLFAPIMLISVKAEESIQSFVQSKAVAFIDQSRTTGCISPENYLRFVNAIDATGHYTVKLEHRAKVAYPDGDGEYKVGYRSSYREEILSVMFDGTEETDYLMSNGDYLTVTITGDGISVANAFSRLFTGTDTNGIAVTYGGYVGNTGGGL